MSKSKYSDNAYGMSLPAAYGDDDSVRAIYLSSDYDIGNSKEEYFSFDVRNSDSNFTGFCSDVHKDEMIEFARWVLEVTGESAGEVINIYNGTVNYYGGPIDD